MTTHSKTRKELAQHFDHAGQVPRLKRIIGQYEGVERMILERRHCPEILQQLRAANSAGKALEMEILKGHLGSCIRTSAKTDGNAAFEAKLNELLNLIKN